MIARLMGLDTISPAGLHLLMRQQQVAVIDVNSPESWAEGHVPGAVNLHPSDYTDEQLPQDKGATVVFYCSGSMCRKAPHAARRAEKLGYRNVRVMAAGISGWLASRLPTERGE